MANKLKEINVQIILIQIHEAHSTAWPSGLENTPEPHKCFQDRIDRANEFIEKDNPPFPVYIDGFDDKYEQLFQAWPDKFYAIDKNFIVNAKSTYGAKADALIDLDYSVYLQDKFN